MELDLEIYSVRLTLRGREIWLGWVSAEPWDYFVHDHGAVIWSTSNTALQSEILRTKGRHIQGQDSSFDLDGALRALRSRRTVDANLLIDLWNIFTDFYNTVSEDRVQLFCPKNKSQYNALFANCSAAESVGVEPTHLALSDMQGILDVMERGDEMIFGRTIGPH